MKKCTGAILSAVIACGALACGCASAADKLDDPTILAIFDQANAADIWTARLGVKRAHSGEVKALARMVATDHEAVQQMGRDVAKKMGVIPSPPDNDASAEAQAKAIAILQTKSGPEFDQAYLRHEIAFHQSVITAVKNVLLPSIKNGELRELVTKVLPGFEHHLAATKEVAAKLGVKP